MPLHIHVIHSHVLQRVAAVRFLGLRCVPDPSIVGEAGGSHVQVACPDITFGTMEYSQSSGARQSLGLAGSH